MSNRQVYRIFGVEVFSIEYDFEPEFEQICNTSGQFELAEVEGSDEEFEEDSGFGFQRR
jgi:hypothetical protein